MHFICLLPSTENHANCKQNKTIIIIAVAATTVLPLMGAATAIGATGATAVIGGISFAHANQVQMVMAREKKLA